MTAERKKVLGVPGMFRVHDQEYMRVYFTNEEMLKEGVIITEYTLMYDEDEHRLPHQSPVETMIEVSLLDKDGDIYEFMLYDGNMLAEIQTLGILRTIVSLYKELPSLDFWHVIEEMAGSRTSSAMQSNPDHKRTMKSKAKELFYFLRNNTKTG